jgi:hypothetical protein
MSCPSRWCSARRTYQGYAADAFSPERAARWADPAGGYIHAMHAARWGGYHYRITGKNPDGSLAYEGGWQNNRQMGMHDRIPHGGKHLRGTRRAGGMVPRHKEPRAVLHAAGGLDLRAARIEVVRLRSLVDFRGARKPPCGTSPCAD